MVARVQLSKRSYDRIVDRARREESTGKIAADLGIKGHVVRAVIGAAGIGKVKKEQRSHDRASVQSWLGGQTPWAAGRSAAKARRR
ncbi:MAG: hypothetical protein WD556_09495 [Actinomycetota bacterium]